MSSPTIINDDNIKNLVRYYLESKQQLPPDLQDKI